MPFTEFYMKDKLYLFDDMADKLIDWYKNASRLFRNKWRWTPQQINEIEFRQIIEIYDDLVEDIEEENSQNG